MRFRSALLGAALLTLVSALPVRAQGPVNTKAIVETQTLSAWNSGTSLNATQTIFSTGDSGFNAVVVYLAQTTTLTAGAITFEYSYDNANWSTVPASAVLDPTSTNFAQISLPYTVQASTNKAFLIEGGGWIGLRIKLSTQITGTGSVTPSAIFVPYATAGTVVALSPTASNFNASAQGVTASGATLTENPIAAGALAKTALPTAVSDGQKVAQIADKFGRQVMVPITLRDLTGTQTTTISASTTETTIVSAAASEFHDLVMLIVSNTSTATNTRIDFRDTTGGTVLFSLESIGGGNPVGFALPLPIPQTSSNTNWTAQCATSTTDVRIYAVYAKNR
jgi:hypothetical protein